MIAVIGIGNMGGAIARGLYSKKVVEPSQLVCTARTDKTLDAAAKAIPGVIVTKDNAKAAEMADIIIFAVKPWLLEEIARPIAEKVDLSNKLVISVAAGIGLDRLTGIFTGPDGNIPHVAYLIPNIATEVGSGVSVWCGRNLSDKDKTSIKDLFGAIGLVKEIDEKQMGAAIAIESCGIAYIFRYIHAMTEGGVELGFRPADAQELVMGTMKGAIDLLKHTGLHPEQMIDRVTTPGGMTIKGLNAMEEAGFTASVITGLKAGR